MYIIDGNNKVFKINDSSVIQRFTDLKPDGGPLVISDFENGIRLEDVVEFCIYEGEVSTTKSVDKLADLEILLRQGAIGVKFRRIDYIEFEGLKSKVVSEPFSLDAKEVRDIIVNNPVSKSVSVGKTVNFNIKGGGYNGVTYQWQISKDNGKTWKNSGAMGRTTEQLTFKAEKRMNGFKYRCIVTNGDYKAISNVVTLTVK